MCSGNTTVAARYAFANLCFVAKNRSGVQRRSIAASDDRCFYAQQLRCWSLRLLGLAVHSRRPEQELKTELLKLNVRLCNNACSCATGYRRRFQAQMRCSSMLGILMVVLLRQRRVFMQAASGVGWHLKGTSVAAQQLTAKGII